jgi:trigger factor
MHISIDHISDLKKIFHVNLEKDAFSAQYQSKLRDFQKNAHIKGFRPGKIRLDFIERKYGKNLEEEMVSSLLEKAWQDIVKEHKIKPVAQPQLDVKNSKSTGMQATITIEVAPVIEPLDDDSYTFSSYDVAINENDVQSIIEKMKSDDPEKKEKNADSALGDGISCEITRSIEGEKEMAETMKEQLVILDKEKSLAPLVDNLLGLKKGDKKTFSFVYPKEGSESRFHGKTLHFDIEVLTVYSLSPCSLDALKKKFFPEKEVEDKAFYEHIEQFAKDNAERHVFEKNKESVLEFLLETHSVPMPEILTKEIDSIENQEGKTEREKSLKLGFIVDGYVQAWSLEVSQEAIASRLKAMSAMFGLSVEQMMPLFSKNKKMQENIQHEALLEVFVKAVLKKAKNEKTVLSYKDVA